MRHFALSDALMVALFLIPVLCLCIVDMHQIAPAHAGYGGCLRCHKTWGVAQMHDTQFREDSGCFPLCEQCWKELGTPDKRLPYYFELMESWYKLAKESQDRYPDEPVRTIKDCRAVIQAVMDGK